MKKIITLLLVLANAMVFAQFSVAPNPVYKGDSPNSSSIDCKSVFKNTSASDSEFTWVRIQNLPSGWKTQICDANTCWPDAKDSSTFEMAKGDSNVLDLKLLPGGIPGHTLVKLYVYAKGKRNQGDTVYYYVNAFATGTPKVSVSREVNIYPNPAQGVLNISYEGKGTVKVEIYNIIGNKVKTANHNESSSIAIDDLPNGMYIVKMFDNGKVITKTFTKN